MDVKDVKGSKRCQQDSKEEQPLGCVQWMSRDQAEEEDEEGATLFARVIERL